MRRCTEKDKSFGRHVAYHIRERERERQRTGIETACAGKKKGSKVELSRIAEAQNFCASSFVIASSRRIKRALENSVCKIYARVCKHKRRHRRVLSGFEFSPLLRYFDFAFFQEDKKL